MLNFNSQIIERHVRIKNTFDKNNYLQRIVAVFLPKDLLATGNLIKSNYKNKDVVTKSLRFKMVPSIAFVKINNQTSLSLRVFVNRKEILNNFKKSTSSVTNSEFDSSKLNDSQKLIFEAPVLSSNSIIRLKKPLVKLYLSNKDLQDLVNDLRNDLLLILYELSDELIHQEILNKLKINTVIEYYKITQFIVSKNNLNNNDKNVNISGLPTYAKSIKKLGKYKYSIEFEHNWACNIIINDIRRLKTFLNIINLNTFRNLSTSINERDLKNELDIASEKSKAEVYRTNQRQKEKEVAEEEASEEDQEDEEDDDDDEYYGNEYSYLQGSADSSQLLLRQLKIRKNATNGSKNQSSLLLQEELENDDFENQLKFLQQMEDGQQEPELGTEPGTEDKKFESTYNYRPIAKLGKCIDIHVLKRPRHRRAV